MSTIDEKTIEILNDLIMVNSDRSIAYEKTLKQLAAENADLERIFRTMAADSRKYLYELAGHMSPSGEGLLNGIPTTQGKVYRVWANEKISFSGKTRQALLYSCEFEENMIIKAYDEALKEELPQEIKRIIEEQKEGLQKSLDKIRDLHEMQHI